MYTIHFERIQTTYLKVSQYSKRFQQASCFGRNRRIPQKAPRMCNLPKTTRQDGAAVMRSPCTASRCRPLCSTTPTSIKALSSGDCRTCLACASVVQSPSWRAMVRLACGRIRRSLLLAHVTACSFSIGGFQSQLPLISERAFSRDTLILAVP